ncbi:MAG: radical SAM protein [Bacteroides sp.]|nr:radical SAM protein [Bacteroides sp.]
MVEEEKEVEIDIGGKYNLPKFSVVNYSEKFIVVFPEIAKWMVLDNSSQLDFFKLLSHQTIREAIATSQVAQSDLEWVLVQIEGKSICATSSFEKRLDRSLHLYLTNACNLRCPHCYMNSGSRTQSELSADEIIDIVSKFKKAGGTKIVLSGGEVLMRSDFPLIVKACKDNGLTVEVLTNGTLWNQDLLEEVASSIDKIQISIDGYCEEENAKVRGKGSFNKALYALELMRHYKIPIEIAVTPYYDETLKKRTSEYANFGKHLLEKYKGVITAVKFTGEIFDGRDKKFSDAEKKEYLEIAQEIYRQCYNESGDDAFVEYHKKGGKEGNCNFGNIAIDAEGDIYFCPAVNLMRPFGNVRAVSLETLFANVSRIQHKSHVDSIEPCKSCDLRYICGGECRAIHFSLFSDCHETFYSEKNGRRICSYDTKRHYYEMMIRTNEATLE